MNPLFKTILGITALALPLTAKCDPLITSWFTKNSGQYAHVVQTYGAASTTTWPAAGLTNTGGGVSVPTYSDVQQIWYSPYYVYVRGSGLASHIMGPWYKNGNDTGALFGNWPSNQNYLRRFPRLPQPATSKVTNGGGPIGLWVNGVALYNLLDAFYYDTATGQDIQGAPTVTSGIWVRNALAVESPSFDPARAHQPPTGEYHYHDNPVALRYQLGDNITYNASLVSFSETTGTHTHSPILGWAFDGYPIYGPYGYSSPNDPTSGARRMVSGFVLRNGQNGTTNLAATGRTTLATWSAQLHGISQTLSSSQYGPSINATYTLGRYVEDYDYLGNLGYQQGVNFDLDQYNGRSCVTPEYPNGTYAYFVTIDSAGNGAFPYTIGRQYYGLVSGGQVQGGNFPEAVAQDQGWHHHSTFGWIYLTSTPHWYWSLSYGWLYLYTDDKWSWSYDLASWTWGDGSYGDWAWNYRVQWIYPNGDGTWFYSQLYNWIFSNGNGILIEWNNGKSL